MARVGASLLDARETSLQVVEEIQFGELTIAAAEGRLETDRPLWQILAALAFILLLMEWWFFHRRPEGAPA